VLSEKNWKLESLLRFVLGLLMFQLLVALATSLLLGRGETKSTPTVGFTIFSTGLFQIVTIGFVWRLLREHQSGWIAGFGFKRHLPKALGMAAVGIGIFLPVGWMLQLASIKTLTHFGFKVEMQAAVKALLESGTPAEFVGLGIIVIFLAPVAEETLFRGVLYPAIKQFGFPRSALWGTSVVFALIHLNKATFAPLLLLALLLVWLYEKTDNLLAPIAAHATFNAVNFAMFFLAEEFARQLPSQP
jgi:membrane protease YdiL (CAAX protease family)